MPNILLIEDDEATRVLIAALCARLGVNVETASDGATGVAMIRAQRYDALLLDLMLPKLNGFEVLREVRAAVPDLLARTIVITAASEATLRDFDGGGTLALLRKPFDIADLHDALMSCTGCEGAPGSSLRVVPVTDRISE